MKAGGGVGQAIILASDHRGFALKQALRERLEREGYATLDFGTTSDAAVDYPEFAAPAARAVAEGRNQRAIVICGSGLGVSYTANRFPGVRAAWVQDVEAAEAARRHNDANVLALPGDRLDAERAWPIVKVWLETPFDGGRHARRVELIDRLTRPERSDTSPGLAEVDPEIERLIGLEGRRQALSLELIASENFVSEAARPELLAAFRSAGFGAVPVGAEPIFDPRAFSVVGGARATVRAAVNHATKGGLEVVEHHPMSDGAASCNAELATISDAWLRSKGGSELGFLLGQPLLDRLTQKRYFIARQSGRIEAFLVCEPVPVRRGWYLDVTRRRPEAPRGAMELLSTTALGIFGREEVAFASMGLAPLGMLELGDPLACDSAPLRQSLGDAFERLDAPYDFRNLLRYKTKYAPDFWEPRFLCYSKGNGERVVRLALRTAMWRAKRDHDTKTSREA